MKRQGDSDSVQAFLETRQEYLEKHLHPVLDSLVGLLLQELPAEPTRFIISHLCRQADVPDPYELKNLHKEVLELREQVRRLQNGKIVEIVEPCKSSTTETETDDDTDSASDESGSEDDIGVMPDPPRFRLNRPRYSVSAEVYGEFNIREMFEARVFPKTAEQRERIASILDSSFIFQALDSRDMSTVTGAMEEVVLPANTRIIQQLEDGDEMYVIEVGTVECLKLVELPAPGEPIPPDAAEVCVKVCGSGDFFGELALLYCSPRAASVVSTTNVHLWKLDRETFCHIVRDAAVKKREMYDLFISTVPILQHLDPYERSKIADALKTQVFEEGARIVSQGEVGHEFFLVEDGKATALKRFNEDAPEQEVMHYGRGDYFGELAILRNEPRAASVVAKSTVKVAFLNRHSFNRLLGPLEPTLVKNSALYQLVNKSSSKPPVVVS